MCWAHENCKVPPLLLPFLILSNTWFDLYFEGAVKVASELHVKITWVHVSRLPIAAPGHRPMEMHCVH